MGDCKISFSTLSESQLEVHLPRDTPRLIRGSCRGHRIAKSETTVPFDRPPYAGRSASAATTQAAAWCRPMLNAHGAEVPDEHRPNDSASVFTDLSHAYWKGPVGALPRLLWVGTSLIQRDTCDRAGSTTPRARRLVGHRTTWRGRTRLGYPAQCRQVFALQLQMPVTLIAHHRQRVHPGAPVAERGAHSRHVTTGECHGGVLN